MATCARSSMRGSIFYEEESYQSIRTPEMYPGVRRYISGVVRIFLILLNLPSQKAWRGMNLNHGCK